MKESIDASPKSRDHAPEAAVKKPGRPEPAAYGVIERLADRLRDLGLWLMRLVS